MTPKKFAIIGVIFVIGASTIILTSEYYSRDNTQPQSETKIEQAKTTEPVTVQEKKIEQPTLPVSLKDKIMSNANIINSSSSKLTFVDIETIGTTNNVILKYHDNAGLMFRDGLVFNYIRVMAADFKALFMDQEFTRYNITNVTIQSYEDEDDDYGYSHEVMVLSTTWDSDTAHKFNWDNMLNIYGDSGTFFRIAKDYYIDPSYRHLIKL